MKLPWTLFSYIARHFLTSIMLATLGLMIITELIDVIEMIRRASTAEHVSFGVVLGLTALKIPTFVEKLLPYGVLIGSMIALIRLTRTQELVVARAAGVSVWQFLSPALAVVLTLGLFMATVFNPFAAALMMRYEQMEAKYFSGRPSLLSISSSGLWLRQIEKGMPGVSEHIIYSTRVLQSDMSFSKVIVFTFDKSNRFTERLDAEQAVLEEGLLRLTKVTRSLPNHPPEFLAEYRLPTTLTLGHIQDSFAAPETLSFWRLPGFITMLENAGFSALRHRLYFQSLLAAPFLMAGTVLVAATFSLRLPRRGKIGILVVAGIVAGFILHFFTDVIYALGSAGTLPVMLAGWTPAIVVIMIGAAMMLHLEDG